MTMALQPAPMTRVRVDRVSDLTVPRFSGDITGISNDVVFNAYRQVPAAARKLVLDFTKVEYINSSGIALIIHLMMAVNKDNRAIQSFGLSPHFQKVFAMVGLNRYTYLHPDEASACNAFTNT